MATLLTTDPRNKLSDTRPLYDRLKQALKDEIVRDFLPNQKFYSVRKLTDLYDVSTITVTRALRELVDEKILYSQRGKGMFIAPQEKSKKIKAQYKSRGLTISIPMTRTFDELLADPEGIGKEYLGGIADAARKNNVVVEFQLVPLKQTTDFFLELIERGPSQGVILYGSSDPSYSRLIDKALQRGVPYVALQPERGLSWEQIDRLNLHYVTIDQQEGIRQTTTHLLDLGHRRIAYWEHRNTAFTRQVGFRQAMRLEGADVDPTLIERDFDFDSSCIPALRQLIDKGATALVTASDYIAMKVLREAKEAGINIPDELSVTGFDDNPSAQKLTPPLTTVSIDRYQAGQEVTIAMLRQFHHPESDERYRKMMPAKLIVRQSTKPLQ